MVDAAIIDEWLSAQYAPSKAREQTAPLVPPPRTDELNARSAREGGEKRRKIEAAKEVADNARACGNPKAHELSREVERLEAEFEQWRKNFFTNAA